MVTFYIFTMKKVNGFSMSTRKISSEPVVRDFEKNQLKDKYVTNNIKKLKRKEGYCENNLE